MIRLMPQQKSLEEKPRRFFTAVMSFGAHLLVLTILAAIPLIYTDALPLAHIHDFLVGPPTAPPPPPPGAHMVKIVSVEHRVSAIEEGQLRTPAEIPQAVPRIVDEGPLPTSVSDTGPFVEGAMPGGGRNAVPWSPFVSSAPPKPVSPPREQAQRTKLLAMVSSLATANLIYAPKPIFPSLARIARIQGTVVLEAIISKDGAVENLRVIEGHPLLVEAAIQAVKQWRYRPTLLNGEAVEVQTTITVNFRLN